MDNIKNLLKEKRREMIVFINRYLSEDDLNRIGNDLINIMPSEADLAKIKVEEIDNRNLQIPQNEIIS